MLRKVLATLGLVSATAATAAPPYSPYSSEAANAIYNLLFCDDAAAFLAKPGDQPASWQATLASSPPDIQALQTMAADRGQEGRVRYLAYQQLRQSGHSVPSKQLLGVIVEVPLAGGLDALAAYSEGGVRYVNQSGKIAVVEGVTSFMPLVEGLLAASQPVVNAIGPWKEARRAPPTRGNVRLTFLVSDGLYFGEGPLSVMQREQMAAPIIHKATELLQAVVAAGTK
ncbi:MAG: hypothetical protein IPP44_00340 [Ideonella sp.]|nr:hypothetical protein [Ideonella sp.]